MKTIYKYQFEIEDRVAIKMPYGAEIISVQLQNNVPTIWAKVDVTTKVMQIRWFSVFGTAHPVNDSDNKHLATLQMSNGLVWHIFE